MRLHGPILSSRILESDVPVQGMRAYGEVDDIPASSLPLHWMGVVG